MYTINNSCCFICVFALWIDTAYTVYPPVRVEGVIGGSVVLPCASSKNEHNLQDTEVHWRHNDSHIVYDIIRGTIVLEEQNSLYKDRAESFPEEFVKGNFSIKLENLTHKDAGKYKCFIKHSSELVIVELLFKESTEAEDKQPAEEGNQAEETKQMLITILIPVAVVVFLCSFVCIAYKMKGGDRTFCSWVSDLVGYLSRRDYNPNISELVNQGL